MVIRDDDVQPALPCLRHLFDRRDPAVDREDEADTVVRESPERLARDAVAPRTGSADARHVGAQLAQEDDGERGRTDPVHVVVAVDADAGSRRNGLAEALHRDRHVAEKRRIVIGISRVEETARRLRLVVAAPGEDGRVISLTPISAASRRARCTSNGAIVQGLVTHGDGTEAIGRRQERDSRRRRSRVHDDLHPQHHEPGRPRRRPRSACSTPSARASTS